MSLSLMQAKGQLSEQTIVAQSAGPAPCTVSTLASPASPNRLFPHGTTHTTCPPAPLVSGTGPIIIVPSIIRSGTHLLLDAMFNNFPCLRRTPLFMDFDAYERGSMDIAPLELLTGMVIKSHYPQIQLRSEYVSALVALAERAVVITVRRPAADVRRSLAKCGCEFSESEFAEMEKSFWKFWTPYAPVCCEFSSLIKAGQMPQVLEAIQGRTGLSLNNGNVVMPAKTPCGVHLDRTMTLLLGGRAWRVNTSVN